MATSSRKNELLYRVYAVLFVFFLITLAIGYRVVQISLIEGDQWRAKKGETYFSWRPLPTQRGNIYADDGQSLLATSVEFFDVSMDPTAASSKNFTAGISGLSRGLAKYDNRRTADQWKQKLINARKNKNKYIAIAKGVDHDGYLYLKSLPILELGQYKGGFIADRNYKREKPYKALASRSVGVYRDQNMVGLEHSFDRLLTGEEKKQYVKRLPGDVFVPVFDPTDYEIIKGKDLVTTINVPLQDVVHNELLNGIQQHNATAGTAIMMEVKTGRIVAMSNLSFSKKGQVGEYKNFAVAHKSEPGSTMKAASVLALLEDDFANGESLVDFSRGRKKFYDLWMEDSSPHGYSKSTLREAFEISSNVGIASAAFEGYEKTRKREQFAQRYRDFGLADLTGVELSGEPKPFIKHPKVKKDNWSGTTIPWMAHGYELEMTPLQVLRFYNAVANDGKLMDAQLVTGIKENGKVVKSFSPKVKNEAIASLQSIQELQSMMEGVVERGTGRKLKSKYYQFAGKTGTTKVGYAGNGEVNYNASFAGYWPAKSPKYSMIVVVYGLTGKMYYGNAVAGPIFKRIMDWSYAIQGENEHAIASVEDFKGDYKGGVFGYGADYTNIFQDLKVRYEAAGRWIKGQSGQEGEVLNGKAKITKDVMPDLEGMGLRDAVYVLENLGMDVHAEGYGKVSKQSIAAGHTISGKEVKIYLN